ncbi:unnamed protein product [Paramecium sonneborni]|uniref:Uncharacterized protein n=1 Tax=Paramecium sonneborni TaxID=65129 RepID=A0A8S1KPG4_9CILI|nr:unnamed protein product [Paramecium sonneborni]
MLIGQCSQNKWNFKILRIKKLKNLQKVKVYTLLEVILNRYSIQNYNYDQLQIGLNNYQDDKDNEDYIYLILLNETAQSQKIQQKFCIIQIVLQLEWRQQL